MERILTLPQEIVSTLNIPQIEDAVAGLPHHPQKTWASYNVEYHRPPQRVESLLQGIIVHHAASEAPIRNQALYHISAHGWPGIAYTFCIQGGRIFQTNYLDDRTAHASNANDIAFGICVVGDLSKRPITDFEKRAIAGIVLGLRKLYPNLWVKPHSAVTKTSCPCTPIEPILDMIEHYAESLVYASTEGAESVRYFTAVKRVEGLGKALEGPYAAEAKRKLDSLLPLGPTIDLADNTAEGFVARVIGIYNNSSKPAFALEANRKMKVIADELARLKYV